MDVVCDGEDDGCGYAGEVDVSGDGEVWDWECPDCGKAHTTYHDMNGEY